MPEMNMIESVRDALFVAMETDPTVIVFGEDVGLKGGVFGATQGLQEKFGDLRVIDMPLAESLIAGVGIGLAVKGFRPVAEIQFADFIYPAMNQLFSDAARMRFRTNGGFCVPLVVRSPIGGSHGGGLYHSQCPEAYFAHTVGLKVVIPSTPYDAKGLLLAAIRDEDPVIFFEHKKLYRAGNAEVPAGHFEVPIGQAKVCRTGRDLSLFSYGYALVCALEAAAEAANEGINVEVVDLRTLRPLDTGIVLESVRKTGKALVVHEANQFCGFGAEVAALIVEEAFEFLDGPVVRLGGPEVPAVPYAPPLEEWFMPSAAKIAERIRELAAY